VDKAMGLDLEKPQKKRTQQRVDDVLVSCVIRRGLTEDPKSECSISVLRPPRTVIFDRRHDLKSAFFFGESSLSCFQCARFEPFACDLAFLPIMLP
jgi:hypothetical protein